MQDELETLKDLLRGEGVSIDQNMLKGVSANLIKVALVNNYVQLSVCPFN